MADTGRTYHSKCTGAAHDTAGAHSKESGITLFGGCFCPFVQRVWAAFEFLGIPYRYCKPMISQTLAPLIELDEVDPYKKPKELLEVSPKGLVPGLKLHDYLPPRSLNESTVILEYLELLASNTTKQSLLPPPTNPYAVALVRLQADHVNRVLVPAFYRYLQAQDEDAQIQGGKEYHAAIEHLVALLERTEAEIVSTGGASGEGEVRAAKAGLGLYFEGGDLGWIDVMAGPWLFRSTNVLKHYRSFVVPEGPKFSTWLERLFNHPSFKATCSDEQLYLDSYERYAFNRPNTSQVANAINSGRGLP